MNFLENFFESAAARSPDSVAVDDSGVLTRYGELDDHANQIAQHLVAHGVEPNDRVCIFTEKNAGAYAAVLGVLKSGACWVPLGSGQPPARLKQLIETIGPKAVISDPETLPQALEIRKAGGSNLPLLVLGSTESDSSAGISSDSDLSAYSAEKPDVKHRSPDDLAYIIFTSGSTGLPKGVMVLHRNITQFIGLCHDFFDIEEGSRFAHHSDLTFDPSLFDLFYGWSRSGTIVPFNKTRWRINPLLFLQNSEINVWFSVPSAIASIVESGGLNDPALASLRHLLLTGEALSGEMVRAWYDAHPDATIYNVYGTTETAIISHWYKIPKDVDPDKPVAVGRLLPGFRCRLMDGGQIAAPGALGECVDYGSQLSPGYWANPEETSARFIADPIDPRMPQTWYQTGDLLRRRSDGLYEYVGRADTQVKIRGHRIELEEVERTLERHSLVMEAAVIPSGPEGKPNEARLTAYVAGREGAAEDDLRRFLEENLPRYMIPMGIIVDSLPLPRNPNGKIDRRLLADRAAETGANA